MPYRGKPILFREEKKLPFEEHVVSFYPVTSTLTAFHTDGRSYGSAEVPLLKLFDHHSNTFIKEGVFDVGNTDTYKIPVEFSKHAGRVRFLHAWTDTIFSVTEHGIEADYALYFGSDHLKKKTKKLFLNEMQQFFMENPYVFNAGNLVENDEYISFQWIKSAEGYALSEDKTYVAYFSKESGKVTNYSLDQNWPGQGSLIGPLFEDGPYFWGYLEQGEAKQSFRPDDNNPVLVKYRIR